MQVQLVDMCVCLMLLKLHKWVQTSFVGLHSISSLVYMVSEGPFVALLGVEVGEDMILGAKCPPNKETPRLHQVAIVPTKVVWFGSFSTVGHGHVMCPVH